VATPAEDGESLVLVVADGARGADLVGATFPLHGSISGELMRTGRPFVFADISSDPRVVQPVVLVGDMGPAVLTPLVAQRGSIGTVAVARAKGRAPFADEDVRLLQAFAAQAAVRLEYARAQHELQRLTVLSDRERIARELHDGAIQALFAVGLGLQGAAAMTADDRVRERLDGAVNELDRVIRELRNYIFGLRPGIIALDDAPARLVAEFSEHTSVVAVADIDGAVADRLGHAAADVIQMTREALSNVGRHADAQTCRITLRAQDGRALLEVDDDGQGFDPSVAGTGQGLRNLRERAAALGGTVEITSEEATGTSVRVTIPL
jgi:signal transduction histidine kinase